MYPCLLYKLKTASDRKAIHERDAIWLLPPVTKGPVEAALSYPMRATEDNGTHKGETMTSYCQAVSYVLQTYATDDVISEAEADVMNDKQPENMCAVRYSETFWEKEFIAD